MNKRLFVIPIFVFLVLMYFLVISGGVVVLPNINNTILEGLEENSSNMSKNNTNYSLAVILDTLAVEIIYPENNQLIKGDLVILYVETNKEAICGYRLDSGEVREMDFSTGLEHETFITGIEEGIHNLNVTCIDTSGNSRSSYVLFETDLSELRGFIILEDIDSYQYIYSLLIEFPPENNITNVTKAYVVLYNDTDTFDSVAVYETKDVSSAKNFFKNITNGFNKSNISGYEIYLLNLEDVQFVSWIHDNLVIYMINSNIDLTGEEIPLPLPIINKYLELYPSNIVNNTIICSNNNQCNDSDSYTFDTCVNPGQINSSCKHEAIRCLKNSDCGNNTSVKYCNAQGNLCTTSTSYLCNNPGTLHASCKISESRRCSGCPFGCNNQSLVCKLSPAITLYSPLNKIYNTTSIPINLTTDGYSFSEISYIDWNDTRPRWNTLCRNCNEYGLKRKIMKTFDQGVHNLTFRGINGTNIITKNISFFLDSKDPKISSTLPRSGSYTNGSNFYIKYTENNCNSLRLNIYGNNSVSGGGSSCESGINIEKFVNQNLASYNNQQIEYQFIIRDIANNTAESRRTKVKVDTVKPVINSFLNITNGRRVTFILNITELNFDEVNYIDHNAARPITRVLCSSLRNGICTSTKTFSLGNHNITITVLDKAGNSAERKTYFSV